MPETSNGRRAVCHGQGRRVSPAACRRGRFGGRAFYDQAKAKPSDFIPLELTERMLNGESPIRVYREYRGLTQDQLAEQAKISKPFLSQIENAIRTPSLNTLKRLAEALRVDMDDLV